MIPTLPASRSQAPSKSHWLCGELKAIARRLGPGAKLPKVTELCRDLGAAPATLNEALKVLESEGEIVRRHAVGIFVAPRKLERAARLALVCDEGFFRSANHSPFWDLLLEQIRARAAEGALECESHFVSASQSHPLQKGLMTEIAGGSLGGVIGLGLLLPVSQWIIAQGVPLVNLYGKGHIIVNTATETLIRLGVEALDGRRCRRIGLWQGVAPQRPKTDSEWMFPQQTAIFRAVLEELGLACDEALIEPNGDKSHCQNVETRNLSEQGFETARRVFGGDRALWPDAIVSLDDTFTHGALVAMQKLGVVVGRDLQLVSHCNRESPVLMGQNNIIRIEFDPREVAAALLNGILELLPLFPLPPERFIFVQPRRLIEATFQI